MWNERHDDGWHSLSPSWWVDGIPSTPPVSSVCPCQMMHNTIIYNYMTPTSGKANNKAGTNPAIGSRRTLNIHGHRGKTTGTLNTSILLFMSPLQEPAQCSGQCRHCLLHVVVDCHTAQASSTHMYTLMTIVLSASLVSYWICSQQ